MNILKKCRRALATLLALTLTTAFASAQELATPTWAEIESKDNLIRFAWNEVEGADEYRIEKLTNDVWGAIPYTTSNTSFGWKCHYESKSPFTYRSETFRVVAISSTGAESAASSPFTVRLADGTPYFYVVGNSAGAEGNTTRTAYVQPVSDFDESIEDRQYVLYFSSGGSNEGGSGEGGSGEGGSGEGGSGEGGSGEGGSNPPVVGQNQLATPTWTKHSVKNTAIKLEWAKVDNALNYTLYYKEASASKFFQRVVATNSTTYYGIKNKTYEFYLVANPKAGKGLEKSAASETKTILLNEEANPNEPLPTPTWTKHSVKNTEIKLEWSKVADALNYTLYYKEASAQNFLQRVVATNSTTYYGIKNRAYDFFVVANPKYNDGYDVSAASETKTILLNEEANPKEPLPTPTWTKASASKTKISLAWSKVDNALNYTLYYKEASAQKFLQRIVATTSTTYYGVKGKTYDFFVVANPKYNDGNAVSAASETKTILVDGSEAPKQKLATPTLTNVSASKTKISLAWTEVADALNYSLFYKESTAKNFCKRIVAKTSTTYYGIKGKTYEFYVVANPKCGSDFSASDVSATRTITLDGSSNNGGSTGGGSNEGGSTGGGSNEGGSTGGGSNEGGSTGGGSNEGDSKTPIAAPVLSWKVDGTTITVSWSEDKTEKTRGYKVFWKVKGANGDYQASNEIDGTSYQITGVAGQTYEIYAVAYPKKNLTSEYRYSENSNTVKATIKAETPKNAIEWRDSGYDGVTLVGVLPKINVQWHDVVVDKGTPDEGTPYKTLYVVQYREKDGMLRSWNDLASIEVSNSIYDIVRDETPYYTELRELSLPGEGTYEIRVIYEHVDEAGKSVTYSTGVKEITYTRPVLDTPNLTLEYTGYIELKWTKVANASYYTVYFRAENGAWAHINVPGNYTPRLVYATKYAGVKYEFYIVANPAQNSIYKESEPSDIVSKVGEVNCEEFGIEPGFRDYPKQ